MRLSVIVPCHGCAELTRACVQSLLAQEGAFELEVLLVDNAGDRATQELADLDPRVRVLPQERNLGFAGGVNAGLRAVQHGLCLVLNNDTQAAPEMLQRLHGPLGLPGVGLVAPVSNHVKGRARIRVGSLGATEQGRQQLTTQLSQQFAGIVEDVDSLSGLCLMFHRATIERIGPFDERFGAGNFEDDDLSLRARLQGLRLLIVRDAFLHHEGHRTFQSLGLDYQGELATRREQFIEKWRDHPAGAAHLAAARGDLARAATAAREAQGPFPDWPDADWILARSCSGNGDGAEALGHLRSFLARCPQHSEARLLLAMELVRSGALDRGMREVHATIAMCHVERDDLGAFFRNLGELLRERGLLKAALDCFAMGVEVAPEDGRLHLMQGIALIERGQHECALPVLERAVELGEPIAHTNAGICLLYLGRRPEAAERFATAARLLPEDPAAQANWKNIRALIGSGA